MNEIGYHVLRRIFPFLFDLLDEIALEFDDLARGVDTGRLVGQAAQLCNERVRPAAEAVHVGAGHAQRIGDDRHRQMIGEAFLELDIAVLGEAIDQCVCDVGHIRAHLFDALVGKGLHRQLAITHMRGRIGGEHGVHHQYAPSKNVEFFRIDLRRRTGAQLLAEIIRENHRLGVDLVDQVISRDRNDPRLGVAEHGRFRPQPRKIWIGILEDVRIERVYLLERAFGDVRFCCRMVSYGFSLPLCQISAVDGQICSGDESRFVRRKESDGIRRFLWPAKALHRMH